uniref:Uncharacterized protein n=1 Tax=Arundo donax TaxID=35708 RepID=A0A0A9HGV5_ARUDO
MAAASAQHLCPAPHHRGGGASLRRDAGTRQCLVGLHRRLAMVARRGRCTSLVALHHDLSERIDNLRPHRLLFLSHLSRRSLRASPTLSDFFPFAISCVQQRGKESMSDGIRLWAPSVLHKDSEYCCCFSFSFSQSKIGVASPAACRHCAHLLRCRRRLH